MVRHVWVLAFIDDPFDPPGEGLLGGGQAFIFDLGRGFVQAGLDVTYVTRLDSPSKDTFQRLGPRCRIHRVAAGPRQYLQGEQVGRHLEALTAATRGLIESTSSPAAIHAQYWVSGVVATRLKAAIGPRVFLYPMSFGRAKRLQVDPTERDAVLRETEEPRMLVNCDHIVVGTPDERALVRRLYPEVRDEQLLLAPLWCDSALFNPRPEPADHYVRRAASRFTEGIGHVS
ncbi:MAG TPA: glycosyltransferase [Allosphingosinicella sp.]|jgi:hypothetical protein